MKRNIHLGNKAEGTMGEDGSIWVRIQMYRFAMVVSGVLVFSSCVTDLGEESGFIRFGDLRVGQQSRYIRLHGYQLGNMTSNIYTVLPDTLVVTVIGRDSLGFVLEDHLTQFSGKNPMDHDTESLTYHLSFWSDSLQVIGPSHLFWSQHYGGARAKLCLSPLVYRRFTLSGWKVIGDPLQGKSSGYVLNAVVLNRLYERVNLYYDHFEVDYVPPPDPPPYYCGYLGPTFIYSREYGMIRSRYVGNPQWDEGLCWDLLVSTK